MYNATSSVCSDVRVGSMFFGKSWLKKNQKNCVDAARVWALVSVVGCGWSAGALVGARRRVHAGAGLRLAAVAGLARLARHVCGGISAGCAGVGGVC